MAAILLGMILAALPLDRAVMGGARRFLGGVVGDAERALNVDISYGKASPSILGSLALSSVRLESEDDRRLLGADRLDAAYDLSHVAQVLAGKSGMDGVIKRLTLRNVDISLDLVKDAYLFESLRKALKPAAPQGTPAAETRTGRTEPLHPLEVSARRVRMDIRDPERGAVWTAEIRSLDLALSDREIAIAFDGALYGLMAGSSLPLRRLAVPISLKGSMSRDLATARFSVSLAANADVGVLEPQEFAIVLRDGILEARKVRDDAPFDLYLRYDMQNKLLEAETRFESLALSRIGRPRGAKAQGLDPWFRRPLTGYVSVKRPGGWRDAKIAADVSGSLPDGFLNDDFSFRISAAGSPRLVKIDALDLNSPYGDLRVSGALNPDGTYLDLECSIAYAVKGGKLPLDSRVTLVGEGKEIFLFSDSAKAGGVDFRDFAVSLTRKSSGLDFRGGVTLPSATDAEASGAFTGKTADLPPKSPRMAWEGSLSTGKTAFLEGSVEIEPYDLAPLKPLLAGLAGPEVADAVAGLSIGGTVNVTSDFSRLAYSATDLRIARAGTKDGNPSVVLNLTGTTTRLDVSRFRVSLDDNTMDGRLSAEFKEPGRIAFNSTFNVRDIPYSFSGEYADSRLYVTGDYDFYMSVTGSESGLDGIARVRGIPLPVGSGALLLATDVSVEYRSREDWSAEISRLGLDPDGSLKGRVPSFHIVGSVGPSGGRFTELTLRDSYSSLSGSARFDWNLSKAGRSVRADLTLSDGNLESLQLQGLYGKGNLDAKAFLQSFPVARLLGNKIGGLLFGSVEVSGPIKNPRAEFALSIQDGRLGKKPFAAAAEGEVDGGGVQIWEGSGLYGIHQVQGVAAGLDFVSGEVYAQGGYTGYFSEEAARFRFQTSGTLAASSLSSGGLPDLSGIFRDIRLSGSVEDFSMGRNTSSYWPFALDVSRGQVSFEGGPGSEVTAKVMDDGSFLVRALPPFPLAALVVGRVADKQIAMELSDIRIQMTALWPLVPIRDVRFLSGTATGALSVRGNVSDPEIYGSLRFQDNTSLEVPDYLNAPIGPINSPLEANGRVVTLIQPVIGIGENAKASVSLSFELSQWIPRSFSLRARSLDSTQIPLKTRFLGMNITGTTDADIALNIGNNLLSLTGNLVLPRAEVVIDPSVMQGGRGKESESERNGKPDQVSHTGTKIDLDVQIGKGVTFYFPSKDFPVIIGQADPSSRLKVSFDNREQAFALKGNAVLRGGNLFYIQRNFYLKSGKMVFNENQYSFDPRVTLEAELRTRDEDNESVKITLRVENESLLNFQPVLESSPSLTQAEIAALLGSAFMGMEDGTDVDLRRTLIASTDIIPQLNFVNIFERNTRRLLGLDLFYVRTEVVQRWLLDMANLDTGLDEGGGGTLADYLDNTSVFAGKYIRDDVFFHTMLQLEQDEPLVNKSSLTLDSEIGFELTTPFFLFDWSLALKHPENLFVSDNSFSFSWKLSY